MGIADQFKDKARELAERVEKRAEAARAGGEVPESVAPAHGRAPEPDPRDQPRDADDRARDHR